MKNIIIALIHRHQRSATSHTKNLMNTATRSGPLARAFLIVLASAVMLAARSASASPVQGFAVGVSNGAEVRTYLGVSPAATSDFFAFSPSFTGGVRVGGGDINNDGTADIIAGAGPGGGPQVKVFNGNNGSELSSFFAFSPSFTGGVFVAGGDTNRDGFADIIVGASSGGSPQVSVFSGANGSTLRSFLAFSPSFTGGVTVAAGDYNGDGFADIIAGAGPGGGPQVSVFSGQDGSSLASFFAFGATISGGISVAAGDVNGDGFADIIAGVGATGSPRVKVFSGKDASTLADFFAFSPSFTGGITVGAADVNGDGFADIIAGTGPGIAGEVKVFDGTNLSTLLDFNPFGTGYTSGLTVGGLVPEPCSGTFALIGGVTLLLARRRRSFAAVTN